MINELKLTNFKAFAKQSIELKPITIFLGPNNSGKSSILSAPRMLSQTIHSYDANVPLLLNGILGDFGTYKDVVHGNVRSRHIEIGISVSTDKDSPNRPYKREYKWWDKDEALSMTMGFKYRSSIKELIMKELIVKNGRKEILCTNYSEDSERHVVQRICGTEVPQSIKAQISKKFGTYHFLPRNVFINKKQTEEDGLFENYLTEERKEILSALSSMCNEMHYFLYKLEYVGAMRLPPLRTYLFSGERHNKVGPTGENAANILAMDSIRKGSKTRNIKKHVIDWLTKAEIASNLKIVSLSDRHYEIHIQNPHSKEFQNFADVGFGNSQVIPVLVGGYNLEAGDTYIVEEPEIHLHPRAQAELGDFFLDLKDRGVQSLVETHSEHLVVRLQQHVANKLISPDDIAIYYVYAKEDGKHVVKMKLDDQAHFTTEWPQGFFPHRLEEAKILAKLRYGRKE